MPFSSNLEGGLPPSPAEDPFHLGTRSSLDISPAFSSLLLFSIMKPHSSRRRRSWHVALSHDVACVAWAGRLQLTWTCQLSHPACKKPLTHSLRPPRKQRVAGKDRVTCQCNQIKIEWPKCFKLKLNDHYFFKKKKDKS